MSQLHEEIIESVQLTLDRGHQAVLIFSYQDKPPEPAELYSLVGMSIHRIQELILEGKLKNLWVGIHIGHENHMQGVLNSLMGINKKRNLGCLAVTTKSSKIWHLSFQ